MDPYLGPVAAALLAALGAGSALGVVRLSRLSLEWWRRRRGPGAAPAAPAAPAASDGASDGATLDPSSPGDDAAHDRLFRATARALAAVAFVGGVGVVLAVRADGRTAALAGAPGAGGAGGAAATGGWPGVAALPLLAAEALLVIAITLLAAAAAYGLDRALVAAGTLRRGRGLPPAVAPPAVAPPPVAPPAVAPPPGRRADPAPPAAADSFGAGLAYVALCGATVGAWGALAGAAGGRVFPAGVLFVGAALLAVPAASAVAAERTPDPGLAARRHATALAQLAAAPAWIVALAALAGAAGTLDLGGRALVPGVSHAAAWVAFGLALLATLPHRSGAPGAAARSLAVTAHHAWLAAGAALLALFAARDPGGAAPWTSWLGIAAGIAFALVVARAALDRLPAPWRARLLALALPLALGDVVLHAAFTGVRP